MSHSLCPGAASVVGVCVGEAIYTRLNSSLFEKNSCETLFNSQHPKSVGQLWRIHDRARFLRDHWRDEEEAASSLHLVFVPNIIQKSFTLPLTSRLLRKYFY